MGKLIFIGRMKELTTKLKNTEDKRNKLRKKIREKK